MKVMISYLFILATPLFVVAQPQDNVPANGWTVPDITYVCKATIVQDWSQGEKGRDIDSDSFFIISTEPFNIVSRTTKATKIFGADFKKIEKYSDLKSLEETDIGEIQVTPKLVFQGDKFLLEAVLTTHPRNLNKSLHLVLKSQLTDEKERGLLELEGRFLVGKQEDIEKSGPITFLLRCGPEVPKE